MGNKIPCIKDSNPPETPKTIQDLLTNAYPTFQKTLSQEGDQDQLTQLMNVNIMQYLDDQVINYGLGAMFGAFIGDALGSYLEFETKISEKQADKAMKMPGGGTAFPFLLPGMFTDDSELASHMLRGLLKYDPSKSLKQQQKSLLFQIADQYNQWYNSSPFDIGHTTRAAMRVINQKFGRQQMNQSQNNKQILFEAFIEPALEQIVQKNKSSESNGSLMRITPMAFFTSLLMEHSKNKDDKEFKEFHYLIRNEINMTHGSEAIFQTSEAYVDLLVGLIRRKDKKLAQVQEQFEEKYTSKSAQKDQQTKHARQWIKNSKGKPPSAIISMGWAKIAFSQTLITLRRLVEKQQKSQKFMDEKTYRDLIKQVLILGGDTDTNGAIVGGLIGAVLGFKNLPIEYLDNQFKVNMKDIKNSKDWLAKRTQYEPHKTFLNAMKLIQKFSPQIEKQKQEEKKVSLGEKMIDEAQQQCIQGQVESKSTEVQETKKLDPFWSNQEQPLRSQANKIEIEK